MCKKPEIRIFHAFLLAGNESKVLAGERPSRSYEEYQELIKKYREVWSEHEDNIISALQEILGVEFYKDVLDVACAPWFTPKSEPLIMNYRNEPDQFIDVLMHELCHVLLTDNNVIQGRGYDNKVILVNKWRQMYGDYDNHVLAHIPVHALSEMVYLDVLEQNYRLDRDKEDCRKWKNGKPYVESWNYVEQHGYKQIIEDLRKMYEGIKNEG